MRVSLPCVQEKARIRIRDPSSRSGWVNICGSCGGLSASPFPGLSAIWGIGGEVFYFIFCHHIASIVQRESAMRSRHDVCAWRKVGCCCQKGLRHGHSWFIALASWGVCVYAGVASLRLGRAFVCVSASWRTRDHATRGGTLSLSQQLDLVLGLLFSSVPSCCLKRRASKSPLRARLCTHPLVLARVWILDSRHQMGNGVTPSFYMMILAGPVLAESFITACERKIRK